MRALCSDNNVADHSQFRSAPEAVSPHDCQRDLWRAHKLANHIVEFFQHLSRFVASVGRNINAGRKMLARTGEHDRGEVRLGFNLRQSLSKLLHHWNVDDVLLAMSES